MLLLPLAELLLVSLDEEVEEKTSSLEEPFGLVLLEEVLLAFNTPVHGDLFMEFEFNR